MNDERAHLEEVHHQLCNALTSLRSNLELVRLELRKDAPASGGDAIDVHVTEAEFAVDRLEELARSVVLWHSASRAKERVAEPAV